MTSQAQQALDHDFDLDVRVARSTGTTPSPEFGNSAGCPTASITTISLTSLTSLLTTLTLKTDVNHC